MAAADKRDEDGRLLGSRKAVEKTMPVLEGWTPPIVRRTTRALEWEENPVADALSAARFLSFRHVCEVPPR